ncbi:MAG TPA: hypothetical protein ENJ09_09080 [Planctomycetes bacterium]|nr:hypothetical protein [Planctomycetota bacterium]
MRFLNVLLAILVSAVLGLAVFNFGLSLLPAYRITKPINRFDPVLGWSKKPDFETDRKTSEFHITFKMNSMGLRDDPMASKEKAPNTFRVMMLGDSFVLGYTVDRKDLFVDQLEHWWNREDRRVDVINAGTEGYSTDQEVLWYQTEGEEYEPDLVLLFPYENDIYWNGQDHYQRFPKPRFRPDGTLEPRELIDPGPGPQLHWALQKFLASFRRPSGTPSDHFTYQGKDLYAEWAPLLVDPPEFLDDCIARTKGALIALRSECEKTGAKLVVAPIPSESAIHPEAREAFRTSPAGLKGLDDELWDPNRPVNLFLGLCEELGIKTLDARPTLRAEGKDAPLYFDAEWHFNPRGNEAFARFLHDSLDGLGVFPPEHGPRVRADFEPHHEEGGFPTWAIVFLALWGVLGTSYAVTYRDENPALGFLKVGGLLAMVFSILFGVRFLLAIDPRLSSILGVLFVLVILGFVAYKLGRRLGTIFELIKAFTLRGHWYLMPLVVVLLSIGSLLVVAASSPLIAPFIYTLF